MIPPYWLFGAHLRILQDGLQTHAAYDLIEGFFPEGTQTPLHLHTKYDELIYVLEGVFSIYTHNGMVKLSAGEHILVPQNTPHVMAASGKKANRALYIASPSGFAKLLRLVGIPDLADGLPPGQPNDMGLFIELSQESGDIILGSPGALPLVIQTDDFKKNQASY
jgi:mannose-6-phosphate isomerase-like protein (cupin superfamily)